MLRYLVLILLIVLFILVIVNVIFTKILKTFSILSSKPKRIIKSEQEVMYQDDKIIVLKGESKQEGRNNNERN
ncbi:MAG: hypothetical protein ACK42Z_02300 [Candidatus Kapaibacteriota bacterium]